MAPIFVFFDVPVCEGSPVPEGTERVAERTENDALRVK